ncbi:MAG: chemotaxis response regulator protein-glutamate methylesterase [Pseudomonadota bacterium]
MTDETIKALVVDDSALMRKWLTQVLSADNSIEVIGTASDPFDARNKIKALKPDVLTLDVEMPKMDGLSFLANLMKLRPMPVVMVSSLTTRGADVTLKAMSLGAVDFIGKPTSDAAQTIDHFARQLRQKVKVASKASVVTLSQIAGQTRSHRIKNTQPGPVNGRIANSRLIAIGASTGGIEAIKDVLVNMRPDCPGIVIAQHIPPVFSKSFAMRMDQVTPLTVREAEDGLMIEPGHAYVAPGDRHLVIEKKTARYYCRLDDSGPVNRHKPSVDVLFDSVADQAGANAIAAILTGMGRDGALGLRRIRDAGARTLCQDEQSSVVWGMPRAALQEGGAEAQLPLRDIADRLMTLSAA